MTDFVDIECVGVDDQLGGDAPSVDIKHMYLKMGGIVVFVAACIAVFHFTPLKDYISAIQAVKEALSATGYWVPLVFFGLTAGMTFIGAPRLPFCVLGGMLFGFLVGLILSLAATLLGAYGPFTFGRYTTRQWVTQKLERFEKANAYLKNPTIFNVFLIRQLPIWGLFTNLLLGSIGVSHFRFFVGSFFGFLPQAVIFSLIGCGIVQASFLDALSQIWAAVSVLLIAALVTWRLVIYARKRNQEIDKAEDEHN